MPSSQPRRPRSSAERHGGAYDQAFARNYHWLYDDGGLRLGTATPGVRAALFGLTRGARILDVACGIGVDALALANRGFDVVAADASEAMVGRCRARLSASAVEVPVVRSSWADLDRHVERGTFDAVLCAGNSLAHAADHAEMVAALKGFATVLASDGVVIADTHHWEALVRDGGRVVVDPPVERNGLVCRRSFRWRLGDRVDGPHVLDIDLEVSGPLGVEHHRHTIEQTGFTVSELRDRLREAGLSVVTLDAHPDEDRYTVVARRR